MQKIESKTNTCPICEVGTLKEVNKKTCFEFSNPGQIVIESKVQECSKCGETFLDEKEAPVFAKKADKLLTKYLYKGIFKNN